MTAVLRRSDSKASKPSKDEPRSSRAAALASGKKPKGVVRRRRGRLSAGVIGSVVGSWLFASLYVSAGHRANVLVLAHPVARLSTIQRSDLRVVGVAADMEAESVKASRVNEFVGRIASSDLPTGSLLTDAAVLPAGQRLLSAEEAIVGILLSPGDGQLALKKGTPVVVVIRPPVGASGPAAASVEVRGWVLSSAEVLASRERPVELALPTAQASVVSSAAADKRVTIVALAE